MDRSCFENIRTVPSEKAKLICFHHAGGSSSFFSDWHRHLAAGTGVYPVQLRGRGFEESCEAYRTIEEAAADIAADISRICDRPPFLYGHSMGGVLAYYTSYLLDRDHGLDTAALIVTGSVPALGQLTKETGETIFGASDEDFCRFLTELGAIDSRILSIPQFHDLFLPVIRSDFEMTERFIPRTEEKLKCCIHAYGGRDDRIVSPALLDMWQDYTTGCSTSEVLEGDHFFINRHRERICSDIDRIIEQGLDN